MPRTPPPTNSNNRWILPPGKFFWIRTFVHVFYVFLNDITLNMHFTSCILNAAFTVMIKFE